MGDVYSKQNYAYAMAESVKRHQFSIGLLLVFFGVADLWFIMPNMYAALVGGWHADWRFFYFFMPQWVFTIPILLIMTLIGTILLSVYCIKGIQTENVDNKQQAAILVAALGFTYQVIGAWPFWGKAYPWPWQTEIANYGNLLVLPLFIGSLIALLAGTASLYVHSKIYDAESS